MEPTTTKTNRPNRRKWRSKTGPKREKKWEYGKQSELVLVVKVAGNFIPNIASIDVRNKYRAPGPGNDYPQARKIELLKTLMEKGGMKGNNFNPAAVEFAAICPNESGTGRADLRKALEIWKPGTGWTPNQMPKSEPTKCTWRVWLAGAGKTHTIEFEQIKPYHPDFCTRFFQTKPDVIGKYVAESGDLPAGFLISAHLADAACQFAKSGAYQRCYIYNSSSSSQVCRVDLGTGRLMGIGTGNGWVNPAIFQNL